MLPGKGGSPRVKMFDGCDPATFFEVQTTIVNLSTDPMPVAIGFHPYFQLTDSFRDEWTLSVGARTHWLLTANTVPTGATEPIERFFPTPSSVPLRSSRS